MGVREAAQSVLRVLIDRDAHPDPYLELVRLGAEHEDIEAKTKVTLIVPGGIVTGTVISPAAWEQQFVRQLQDEDHDLRRAVRTALDRVEDNADNGKRRVLDRWHIHLRDVTIRDGRTTHTLPTWRGPIAAVSGWTLGHPEKG
ncbi:hypothetical protein [Kitasatospora sp. NPDC006786]|uniref:hypothetical protein n=1 Tax=unclassified Kitasatospora TaxID=2633591 RepID=UPI0033FFBF52